MFHTQITSVSVYRRGCVIHRRGTVRLSEGSQSIRLLGPGRGIDPDSLRLSVPEGVEGANVQLGYLTPMEQEEMLKELQMSLQKLSRQIESAREQRELWKQNADFTARDHISLTEMTGYLEQLPQRLEALEERLDQLEKEQDSLNKALAEQQRKAQLPYISAELKTTVPGEYPIEVRYKDNHAAWAPLYELHASEEEQGSLLLRLRSRISQSTGEDWNRVRLHLFSGNPALSGTIPQLQPRLLQFYEPPRMSAKAARARPMMDVAAAGMVMEESVEVDRTEELPSLRMSQVNANSGQTIQGDTMTEYELSGQWDIRDGQNILCDLRSDEIPCRYQVVAVPRVSEEAYLSAEVKTADLEEMQRVEASVYLKGTFAGQVVLQPDMTEETYQLSLGVDETVKVKRPQKKRYTSQSLLKGQKKTEYEFEIALSSRKPKACRVQIQDQIPVSEEKSIQVEVQELSGGEREEKTGMLKWNLELQPGESQNLTLAYSIAWPKDKQIQGI